MYSETTIPNTYFIPPHPIASKRERSCCETTISDTYSIPPHCTLSKKHKFKKVSRVYLLSFKGALRSWQRIIAYVQLWAVSSCIFEGIEFQKRNLHTHVGSALRVFKVLNLKNI